MKSYLLSLLLIVVSTSFFNCTPENLDQPPTIREMIPRNPWTIDYYYSGQDKTSQFNGYQLQFSADGKVTATDGVNYMDGTWSIARDSRRNEVLLMNIQQPNLQVLNDQWTVTGVDVERLILQGLESQLRLRRL